MSVRVWPAILAGKAAGTLSRRATGGGATAIPGLVGLKVDPKLIGKLANRLGGSIVVTGTNGKTTTSRFIGGMLAAEGRSYVHNQAGSNLLRGIASTLVQKSAALDAEHWGLFEVDEATMPAACRELKPAVVVVTNLFRDQLDRYGELKRTAEYLRQGLAELPPDSAVVLNADDPLVASLGRGLPQRVLYFGIEDRSVGTATLPHAADSLTNPKTGELLTYRRVFVGHLGHYASHGSWRRPKPDLAVTNIKLTGIAGSTATMKSQTGNFAVKLRVPGLYNVYNVAAAVGAAQALGVSIKATTRAISQTSASFGRVERLPVGKKHLFIGLIKNPTGTNEIITTLALDRRRKDLLIVINDDFADGTDVSWLWDADFERLLPHLRSVAVAGTRAADMAVRLKYAGLPESDIHCYSSIPNALQQSLQRVPSGGTLYVMPTYTAMLALRQRLSKMGVVPHYLET